MFDRAIGSSPGNNGLLLSAARAASAAGDPARVRAWLTRFVAQGGTLGPADAERLFAGRPPRVAGLARAANATREALFARVPATVRLVEGVAQDRRDGMVYVSSVFDGVIARGLRGHSFSRWLKVPADVGSPLGMRLDAPRDVLWAALDGGAPRATGPGGARRGGLLRVDVSTGRSQLIAASAPTVSLGDLGLASDGAVYASDSRSGAIYRCRPGCAMLEEAVAAGRLQSAQGLVPSADGRRLYAADYGYGLVVIDLASTPRVPRRVRTAMGVALDGIDGMVRCGDRLVAVQNGWPSPRVIAIRLDASGRVARSVRVLARGGDPTQVAVGRGGALLLVRNAQWDSYADAAHPARQRPTDIERLTVTCPSPQPGSRVDPDRPSRPPGRPVAAKLTAEPRS